MKSYILLMLLATACCHSRKAILSGRPSNTFFGDDGEGCCGVSEFSLDSNHVIIFKDSILHGEIKKEDYDSCVKLGYAPPIISRNSCEDAKIKLDSGFRFEATGGENTGSIAISGGKEIYLTEPPKLKVIPAQFNPYNCSNPQPLIEYGDSLYVPANDSDRLNIRLLGGRKWVRIGPFPFSKQKPILIMDTLRLWQKYFTPD